MRTSWLIAVLPGLVQPLHAQTASISARQAISDFVSNGSPVQRAQAFATARGILQQEKGAVPRAVIDSVADALARVALRAGGADVHEGSRAIAAIQLGGSSEARVPYPAFTSLKRIATEAADIGIRGAALGAMGGITQKNEAPAFLSEVARSREPPGDNLAIHALLTIARGFGPEGRDALRKLHESGAVTDDHAASWLNYAKPRNYAPD